MLKPLTSTAASPCCIARVAAGDHPIRPELPHRVAGPQVAPGLCVTGEDGIAVGMQQPANGIGIVVRHGGGRA